MENEEERPTENDLEKKTDWVKFIGMVLIGLINNGPYWVAFSSTQSICTHFKKEGFIGAMSWSIAFLSIFSTVGNTFLSSRGVSYTIRAIINGSLMFFGLISTAFSPNIYFAIVFIAFVGVSSDFGEAVMLGYFALLNDESLLKAWGIGNGFSGLFGAGYTLLCQYYSISYFVSFLTVAPLGILYPLIFHFMLDKHVNKPVENADQAVDLEEIESPEPAEEKVPFCSCANFSKSIRFIVNNALNFFLQYVAIGGLSDCSMTLDEKVNKPYIFGIFSITYQFGGLLVRILIKWLITSKLELVTLLLFLSFVVILLNIIFDLFPPIYISIPLCFVGFFGGMLYMSLFDTIMKQPNTTNKDREIITNYVTVSTGASIQVASAFIILMQNTFLKKQCIR
jgi:battenin